MMQKHIQARYPLALTFINTTNIPSVKAPTEKLKWTFIADFQCNNNDCFILAYEMKQAVS